jgi:hypothetical protein
MTKIDDPIEIYRESLASIPTPVEEHPPVIQRAEVWPYPDLVRLWVRTETSPFAAFPNVAFTVTDPDEAVVATMFMVEIREAYQSITLHLRQPPRPGERYHLEIELSRDEAVLDTRLIEFELAFRNPEEGVRP